MRCALLRYRTDNLGDDIQSLATAFALPTIDALIDRDTLADISLPEPHLLVMNSWFFMQQDARPPSDCVTPYFHGFCGGRDEVFEGGWLDYLRDYAPIGCRDMRTVERLHDLGIDAHFTGCLTLSLGEHFLPVPREARRGTYFVDLHSEVERMRVPPALSARAIRLTNHLDPLLTNRSSHRFLTAFRLLRRLAHAELVITRRLHVALPCVALRTPVIVLPDPTISDARLRFSGYETFLPIRWPEDHRPWSIDDLEEIEIPASIRASWKALAARTLGTPTPRDWADPCPRLLTEIAEPPLPGVRSTLRLGIDEEPILRDPTGRLIAPPYPFQDKLRGEVASSHVTPLDISGALYDFGTRMGVSALGRHLSGDGDAAALDHIVRQIAQDRLFDPVAQLWRPVLRQGRHDRLEAEWAEYSVAFGVDTYDVGRRVESLWRMGEFDAARKAIADGRRVLAVGGFQRHADPFHREKNVQILGGFEALLDYEDDLTDIADPRFIDPHAFLPHALYEPIWDAITALEHERARRLALLYLRLCHAVGYGPSEILWAIEQFLVAQGHFAEAEMELSRLQLEGLDPTLRLRREALRARIDREADRPCADEDSLIREASVDWALRDEGLRNALVTLAETSALTREHLQQCLANKLDTPRARALSGQLCIQSVVEALEADNLTAALDSAKRAADLGTTILTEEMLAVIDVLCAHGERAAAARLYRGGFSGYYAEQDRMFPASAEARTAALAGEPREMWFLCGRGIGDDLVRLTIAARTYTGSLRYDIDTRLLEPAARAVPRFVFGCPPRIAGLTGVGRAAYWRAREGVPRGLDAHRLTSERIAFARRGGALMHNEEAIPLFLEGRSSGPPVRILHPSAEAENRIDAALRRLADDRPIIGIAWRSGLLNRRRRRNFFAVEALAPLFDGADALFIVLQHAMSEEERNFLADFRNVASIKGLDVMNDFDALAALAPRLALMIGPRLSTRDVMAAAGARTLSLAMGYPTMESWRIGNDGECDLLFPQMRHIGHRPPVDLVLAARAAIESI